jgi:hypothetical protein
MSQHPMEKPVEVEGVPAEEVPNATDPEGIADDDYPENK